MPVPKYHRVHLAVPHREFHGPCLPDCPLHTIPVPILDIFDSACRCASSSRLDCYLHLGTRCAVRLSSCSLDWQVYRRYHPSLFDVSGLNERYGQSIVAGDICPYLYGPVGLPKHLPLEASQALHPSLITTLAPSLPKTPFSRFGLLSLPFLLDSIPRKPLFFAGPAPSLPR